MQRIFFILVLLFGTGAGLCRAADGSSKPENLREMPSLTADERVALYKECARLQRWGVGGRLMPGQWGPVLVKLNPVLVISHLVNVKVILNDTEKEESGFYVTMIISSYAPVPKDFADLKLVSKDGDKTEGEIYWYRIDKTK